VAALHEWDPEGPMPAKTGDAAKDDANFEEGQAGQEGRWVPKPKPIPEPAKAGGYVIRGRRTTPTG
jgi:hypothetical protein